MLEMECDVMKKKKVKKQEQIPSSLPAPVGEDSNRMVTLAVRISAEERQMLKIYAAQHGTSIAELIRRYVRSVVGE